MGGNGFESINTPSVSIYRQTLKQDVEKFCLKVDQRRSGGLFVEDLVWLQPVYRRRISGEG